MLDLNTADPGSIPVTEYGPLNTASSIPQALLGIFAPSKHPNGGKAYTYLLKKVSKKTPQNSLLIFISQITIAMLSLYL